MFSCTVVAGLLSCLDLSPRDDVQYYKPPTYQEQRVAECRQAISVCQSMGRVDPRGQCMQMALTNHCR